MDINSMKESIKTAAYPMVSGKITGVLEQFYLAALPGAPINSIVIINNKVRAQILKEQGDTKFLFPLEDASGICAGDSVCLQYLEPVIKVGPWQKGRVLGALGDPIDEKEPGDKNTIWSIKRPAPNPLFRMPVRKQLTTGIKVIDTIAPLGKGQRMGLFSGPGEGKSTLLGELALNTPCDVAVICLVGERGREAGEFVNDLLKDALFKSIVVLSTADSPPAARVNSLYTATSIAEWYREKGLDVLLLVDSLTRVIRAKRELDLATGAVCPPSGYPATSFSFLAPLLERAGCNQAGTITGVYTVLTENDKDCAIKQEVTSLLDGHIVLSKQLAQAGLWPAVDPVLSLSRVAQNILSKEALKNTSLLRSVIAAFKGNEDLYMMGAYVSGTCKNTDSFIAHRKSIESFLTQKKHTNFSFENTMEQLTALVSKF